ncbi:MAG: FG-GAP-like repeat-containing protein [Bacteroidota bacterium]
MLQTLCSKLKKHFRQYRHFSPYRAIFLAGIFNFFATATPVVAQRALTDVTSQQLADLPKLTSGAQAWADYDGDKLPDLFISGTTAQGQNLTRLYHNTGKGFEDKSSLLPNLPQLKGSAAAWADYDLDGKPDLAITGDSGQAAYVFRLYHNNGSGFDDKSDITVMFQDAKLPALGYGTVTWGNFDGDQYPDLFLTGKKSDGPFSGLFVGKVATGIGNVFEQLDTYLPGLPGIANSAVACADFNKDGQSDLAIAGDGATGRVTRLYLSMFIQNPYGLQYVDATAMIPALAPLDKAAMATGDYDADGWPDLLMAGQSATGITTTLFHNLQTSQWNNFEEVTTGIPGVKRSKAGWADYDNDGRPDLMIMGVTDDNQPLSRLYHNTTGGFVDVSSVLKGDLMDGSLAWGDYNNDGNIDLAYTGISGSDDIYSNRFFFLLTNNGNGTFKDNSSIIEGEPGTNIAMPAGFGTLTWVDYRHSGALDFFAMGESFNGQNDFLSTKVFFLNDGNEKFSCTSTWRITDPYQLAFPFGDDEYPSFQDGATVWGDYNNDNLPDLLMLGQVNPSKDQDKNKTKIPGLYLLKNEGSKDYMSDVTKSMLPSNYHNLVYSSAEWVDYDGDKWNDLVLTGSDGNNYYTLLYHNNAGQNFTDESSLLPNLPQLAYSSVTCGDYDNDGRPDIILTGKNMAGNPESRLYHNTIRGFVDVTSLLPGFSGVYTGALTWVDYDGDNLLDLLITGDTGSGAVTKLYHNKGMQAMFEDRTDLVPEMPQVATGAAAFGDYDKDGLPDLYISGFTEDGGSVSELYHNTSSGFSLSGLLANEPGLANSSAAWMDYDNDTWPDLMAIGLPNAGAYTKLFHNVNTDVSGTPGDKPSTTIDAITAENQGLRNKIEWTTLHEKRGDWFVVEKLSRNGAFIAIDKQFTKGRPSSYTAYDRQPEFGKNSYRVKIYYRDGSYKTSEVVSVYIGKNDDCDLKAFPNPVHRFVTITLDCDNNFGWKNWSPWQGQGRSGGLLSVINSRGQTVMRVRMTDNRIQLDLSRFSDGLYYVKYDDGHDTKTIKIIKR